MTIILKRIDGEPDYCKTFIPPKAEEGEFAIELCGKDTRYDIRIKEDRDREEWMALLLQHSTDI